jgi:hypothetical protein
MSAGLREKCAASSSFESDLSCSRRRSSSSAWTVRSVLKIRASIVVQDDLERAVDVLPYDELYKIKALKPDGISTRVHRWLAFIRRR